MSFEIRNRFLCKCPKYDKSCIKSIIKHSCWSAIFLGAIMLAIGIVLRSAIIDQSSPTVTSSGMLFIIIGIFIIIMGPFAAIYELLSTKRRANRSESSPGASNSPRPSAASDPPSYNQVMTGLKSPSATYNMGFYPQILSPDSLSDTRPPPPSYAEIVVNDSENSSANGDVPALGVTNDRRMTSP